MRERERGGGGIFFLEQTVKLGAKYLQDHLIWPWPIIIENNASVLWHNGH